MLEKTPESPMDSNEIKPVNLIGNQPWILVRRTDAEAETPVLWSPDVHSWLIGKVPVAGQDWGQKEKRVSEDEMAWWHHWCNGHELGQILGDSERQGGLACCSPWAHKELDMTGWLNNNTTLHVTFPKQKGVSGLSVVSTTLHGLLHCLSHPTTKSRKAFQSVMFLTSQFS